jgi:hypothetical protein
MVCACCRQAIHPDQAEPSALIAIDQSGERRRTYRLCGECAIRLEAGLNRNAVNKGLPLRRIAEAMRMRASLEPVGAGADD